MSDIVGLGYVGLAGPRGDWLELAEILGLLPTAPSNPSEARFRMDDRAWRIAVEEGEPGIRYVGWEVASRSSLENIKHKLAAAGFGVETDSDLAGVRGMLDLITCKDPSGFNLEFFYGAEVTSVPFTSPTGARFVTRHEGRTLGMGHVVMIVDDLQATSNFYLTLLEFQPSDSIVHGAMGVTFTHVNPRHHSLAFGPAVSPLVQGFDHLMLEVDDMDVVGCALDRLIEKGVPVTASLGKHSNDHMTSFYIRTPSGFDIEYGVGGRIIEESWVPTWFRSASIWGHRRSVSPGPG
ncbi:MAG: VOC family protein [Actinomycetota bacterium]|nr:VOC family protein [Actinomycetota bacterium]